MSEKNIGIVLIDEDEVFTLGSIAAGSFEIDYRRMPLDVAARIQDKHTTNVRRRGEVTNVGKVTIDMLKYIIIDWRGVGDRHGNIIEFDSALVSKLPDEIQTDLLEKSKANAALEELEGDSKNSASSHDNSS